jgi:hypothetical protein
MIMEARVGLGCIGGRFGELANFVENKAAITDTSVSLLNHGGLRSTRLQWKQVRWGLIGHD